MMGFSDEPSGKNESESHDPSQEQVSGNEPDISTDVPIIRAPEDISSDRQGLIKDFQREILEMIVSGKYDAIIVDFANSSYVDSAGLGILESVRREFAAKEGRLVLVNLPNEIKSIFEVTRMIKIFQIYDTIEGAMEAIEEFRKG